MGQQLSSDRSPDKSLGQHKGFFSYLRRKISHDEDPARRATGLISDLQGPPPPPPYKAYKGYRAYDKVDSCVRAAWQNHWDSRLIRLPDDLIVAIMERLEEDDILRLRHTSRTFMRLFSQSNAFRKLHLTNHDDEDRKQYLARIWAVPRKCILIPNPNPLCDSCESTRECKSGKNRAHIASSVPFVHCSGCRVKHRAFCFSPQQRRESNDDERICVGHERSLVLCSHVSVTWDMVNRLADRSPDMNTIVCNHKQHLGESEWTQPYRPRKSPDCPHDDRPRLKASRSDNGDLYIKISATVHTRFQPLPLRRDHISSMGFRYGYVVSDLLRYFGDECRPAWALASNKNREWDFTRPFDPNICSCLDWGAPTSRPGFEWKLSPNPKRPWREAHPPGSNFYTGADELRRAPGDRCAGYRHGVDMKSGGKTTRRLDWHKCTQSPSDSDVALHRSSRLGSRVLCPIVLKQTFESRISSAADPEWLRILYVPPLESDEEMAGITWCPKDVTCGERQRLQAWKQMDKHCPSVDDLGEEWVMTGTDEGMSGSRDSEFREAECRESGSAVQPGLPPPYTSSPCKP